MDFYTCNLHMLITLLWNLIYTSSGEIQSKQYTCESLNAKHDPHAVHIRHRGILMTAERSVRYISILVTSNHGH